MVSMKKTGVVDRCGEIERGSSMNGVLLEQNKDEHDQRDGEQFAIRSSMLDTGCTVDGDTLRRRIEPGEIGSRTGHSILLLPPITTMPQFARHYTSVELAKIDT